TNVYFAFNQWTLSDEAKDLIKTQVEGRPEGWTGLLRIDGHTDAQGSAPYNRALGLKRAEAVKTYLVSLGIPETTIQVQSLGKDGAVCQETTPDCLELNRRAHVAFLPQAMDQEEATVLSSRPDGLNVSTQEESSPMMVQQDDEESEEVIPAKEEDLPAELVAIEPLATVESLP
ncbi:MAG: OmpA family protein, partial [Nitrospirota bacterium]|nr:OmpA family protein [Nitrospirota bacterium]